MEALWSLIVILGGLILHLIVIQWVLTGIRPDIRFESFLDRDIQRRNQLNRNPKLKQKILQESLRSQTSGQGPENSPTPGGHQGHFL